MNLFTLLGSNNTFYIYFFIFFNVYSKICYWIWKPRDPFLPLTDHHLFMFPRWNQSAKNSIYDVNKCHWSSRSQFVGCSFWYYHSTRFAAIDIRDCSINRQHKFLPRSENHPNLGFLTRNTLELGELCKNVNRLCEKSFGYQSKLLHQFDSSSVHKCIFFSRLKHLFEHRSTAIYCECCLLLFCVLLFFYPLPPVDCDTTGRGEQHVAVWNWRIPPVHSTISQNTFQEKVKSE